MDRRKFLLGSAASGLAAGTLLGCSGNGTASPTTTTRPVGQTTSTTTAPQPPDTIQRLHENPDEDVRRYGDIELRRRAPSADAPDVVFVSIDDANDWWGFLNPHPGTHTPNVDALAAGSLAFTKAYAPVPMCEPVRTNILLGLPAWQTHIYDHSPESREHVDALYPVTPSLVDDFWAAGYDTVGGGKVFNRGNFRRWKTFHRTAYPADAQSRDNPGTPREFYEDFWVSPYDGLTLEEGAEFRAGDVDFGPSGRPLDEDPDMSTALRLRDELRENRDRPLFLAFGTIMPHTPWRVPQRFFDLHPLEEVVVPEFGPEDLEDLGPYAREEIVDQLGAFERLEASGQWQAAVQAYQAAMSYADACVGVLLDTIAEQQRDRDTVVVLWSDHGFHLGEMLHLHKFTLWERATHVPLVLQVPGTHDSGSTFDAPVSLDAIGPALAEVCGLEQHSPQTGQNLMELARTPGLADEHPPISTWLQDNHAVRRGQWRYIRYNTGEAELYDHDEDPDERVNLAADPNHADIIDELDPFLPDPVG
jgi:arylsulfatase A-like enzyme